MPVLIKAGSLTGVPALQGILPTIFIATKQMALHVMDRDNRITVENYPYIRTPCYFIHPLCQGDSRASSGWQVNPVKRHLMPECALRSHRGKIFDFLCHSFVCCTETIFQQV